MTAPERSLAQRRSALQIANEVRTKRAHLKRDIAAGRRSAGDILREPPDFVEMMKVWDLLLAIPKVGRSKAGKALATCRISASKTIGGLSQRQRDELTVSMGRGPDPVAAARYQAKKARDQRYRDSGQAAENEAYKARIAAIREGRSVTSV